MVVLILAKITGLRSVSNFLSNVSTSRFWRENCLILLVLVLTIFWTKTSWVSTGQCFHLLLVEAESNFSDKSLVSEVPEVDSVSVEMLKFAKALISCSKP